MTSKSSRFPEYRVEKQNLGADEERVKESDEKATSAVWSPEEFAAVVRRLAADEAPRLFAIVEEYGEAEDARVAGYGLAYADRVEVDSVEGGFHLCSQSPDSARALFEVSSRSAGTRRAHLVWLDEPAVELRVRAST
ncbi:hypothetical protein [Saccharothrix hoggarensis]|uniref:Uncharacterized protein n=1 Tax=Saccharothrix hoggarensis TaxID=913853 RepID=A0ABW3QT37_9PSEU